jgi:hypothetical protein
MGKEEEGHGMSIIRCEKARPFLAPLAQVYVFFFPSPFIWQASLVRESENMVRDTTTRLERAAGVPGELGDLIVRATLSPPFV